MAVYDLEEQENIEALKAWWKDYGRLVIAALVAFLVGVGGMQGWRWYKEQQALAAAAVFADLEQAMNISDRKRAAELAMKLRSDFPSTAYAARGALLAARAAFDGGERDKAADLLRWASENGRDEAVKALASLRLSAVLLDLGKHDEAIRAVGTPPGEAFAALFADARGDALAAQGKVEEARNAYQMALDKLPRPKDGPQAINYRDVVEFKRNALGAR